MERSKLSRPSSSATEADTSGNDERNKIGHLREELSDIPFCELEELKQTLGCKKYNKTVYGMLGKKIATAQFTTREDKNKPKEISSKMKVPRLRQVIQVKKQLTRDPRFDDLSGTFHPDKFDKAYEFLEDMKVTEKKELKKELQTTEEQDRKEQLKSLLSRMEEQEAAKKLADTRREAERKRRKAEMELVKQGKRPFFLKKSEKKKLELAEKFKELKSSGKLERYIKRKDKKMTGKERRKMPYRREIEPKRNAGEDNFFL